MARPRRKMRRSGSTVRLAPSPGYNAVSSSQPLSSTINTILPALEQFIQFKTSEVTGKRRLQWTAQLEEPLPHKGHGSGAVLRTLRDVVIPNGLRTGHTGFAGWMSIMPEPLPAAATLAATIAGPQRWWVQSFNTLESIALRWLAELLGIPPTHQGLFTSGGAIANLVGLSAARQSVAERLGVDVAYDGLAGLPPLRIYATEETHRVVHRSAALLGLGRRSVIAITTDNALRMDVQALRAQVERDREAGYVPLAVAATAGTTNSGAIDPLPEIARFCQEQGIWLHIDGAYGLLGILDPEVAPLFGDLGLADSLVIDPHKWLNAPLGCSAVFVRDRALLKRTFALDAAAYLDSVQVEEQEPAPVGSQFADYGYHFHDIGPEVSAPSRGAAVWAILKEQGGEGIRARVRRNIAQARYLARLIQISPDLELVAPVTLSICCFRYVPPELAGKDDDASRERLNALNQEVLRRIQARGRCVPSGTTIYGKFVIRPCFVNPRTTNADVTALVRDAKRCGAEVWAEIQVADHSLPRP
jgi:aromatic-L-amino-acid/L-tryptophan decarboxylase